MTQKTGGLLRERGLIAQRDVFALEHPEYWQVCTGFEHDNQALKISLFGYEHLPLLHWLPALVQSAQKVQIAVTAGKAQGAFQKAWAQLGYPSPKNGHYQQGNLNAIFIPMLNQAEYDQLLWSADLNAVRGEDSLVRAIWAGKPLFWDIYKQDDGAHWDKLSAFCRQYTETMDGECASIWTQWQILWNTETSSKSDEFAHKWHHFMNHYAMFKVCSERFCMQQSKQMDVCTGLMSYCI